jgi:hypothetical protein
VSTEYTSLLRNIRVSINMHDSGSGRFIARIAQDCECGQWGITITLAQWSNLASVTESALCHLASAEHQPRLVSGEAT